MRIKKVTITGADDNTDITSLVELQAQFPFVEWGILFSPKRQGTARYPSLNWVNNLYKTAKSVSTNLSAHLCGGYAVSIINSGTINQFQSSVGDPVYMFQRIQLNFNCQTTPLDRDALTSFLFEKSKTPVILQYNKANRFLCGWIADSNKSDKEIHFLHDGSGGRGVLPSKWPATIPRNFTGYAGGLNPDNLEKALIDINESVGDQEIWIDTETGVRTNEIFDIRKVYNFLTIAEKWSK